MLKIFMMKKFGGYLIGALLGLLIGAILYFVQPITWKGEALVKLGQISQNQNQNQSQNFIEPFETVMERLKSRSFIQSVAERAKKVEIVKLLSPDEDAGMAIKSTRNADTLIITVQGGSTELVRDSLDALATELIFKHDAIVNAYQADTLKELTKLDDEQVALSKRLGIVAKSHALEIGFSVMAMQHALDYKLNRSSQLRWSISSANIRPTTLIEDISVTEKRMFSSLWRACLFGAFLGVFLMSLWLWLKRRG